MDETTEQSSKAVSIAIVIAGIIIAGAVFFNGKDNVSQPSVEAPPIDIVIKDVSEDDHILGNPNAEVTVIEFSDIDCPFCAQFHITMKRIIDEYGPTGQVAWVYRHLPIPNLHPDAPQKSYASECVAEIGGNVAFWDYLDILFERNDEGVDDLANIATQVGVDEVAFNECLDSGRTVELVQEDLADAQLAGGRGTPYSVIVTRSGQQIPIDGAQPYENIKPVIEALLGDGI